MAKLRSENYARTKWKRTINLKCPESRFGPLMFIIGLDCDAEECVINIHGFR